MLQKHLLLHASGCTDTTDSLALNTCGWSYHGSKNLQNFQKNPTTFQQPVTYLDYFDPQIICYLSACVDTQYVYKEAQDIIDSLQ